MKKLIIGLLILAGFSIPSFAAWNANVAPMPIDYVLHGLAGATGQALLDNFYPRQTDRNNKIMWGVGFAKELYDCTHGGYFDFAEWGATVFGSYVMADSHRRYIAITPIKGGLAVCLKF